MNRSAAALLLLQPLVTPPIGMSGPMLAGQVAGARSDQNTFFVDGADATEFMAASGSYVMAAIDWVGPTPAVPVPLESVEEFRLVTTNPNATFGRSSGGQVSYVTRRGTNALHGSTYWYHRNDNLNANTWTLNRLGRGKPELKDNRFGASLGGPLWKDRLFLFGHYEGRRLPKTATVTRLVPSRELRQGGLRFLDATGRAVSYRILDYDPRGRGLSPVVSRFWSILPEGNNPAVGDGLNTVGLTGTADASLGMNFGVARLDYHLSERWRFAATHRYASQEVKDTGQVDIAGLTGGRPGEIRPGGLIPVEPRFFSAQMAGSIRPNLINETIFGYTRNYWAYRRVIPFPQVSGTAAPLMVAYPTLDTGLDVDAVRARNRVWREHTWQASDNLTWIQGRHSLNLGGTLRHVPVFRELYDKVFGPLTSMAYELNASTSVGISGAARPPTCGGAVTTNCLRPADVQRWNDLFAGGLGIVDTASVIATRGPDLKPLPLGTPMRANLTMNAYDVYASDIWRITPDLTLSLGLA